MEVESKKHFLPRLVLRRTVTRLYAASFSPFSLYSLPSSYVVIYSNLFNARSSTTIHGGTWGGRRRMSKRTAGELSVSQAVVIVLTDAQPPHLVQ